MTSRPRTSDRQRRGDRHPWSLRVARRRNGRDEGYILVLTTLMLIPLIAFTAFAVDLGAWYAQSSKMQRAVDNAALAGVVWLPDQAAAKGAATKVLQSNGYTGQIAFDFPSGGQQMKVGITRTGEQYFSQLVTGKPSLTRSATAEFNKPVPLGSPANSAGNIINSVASCAQFQPSQASPCGPQPMLWQAIQGPYETHSNGDAYATFCATGKSGSGCGTAANPSNVDYQPNGYEYAIEVPQSAVNTNITVEVWDAVQAKRTTGNGGGNDCNGSAAPWSGGLPSNFGYLNCQTGDEGSTDRNDIPMQYQIWDNDGSDLTVGFNSPLSGCELFIPRDTAANPTVLTTYKNKWATVCTFKPTKAGIYPMRVKSSNITRPDGTVVADSTSADGWNAYALRATSSASGVRLYSLTNLSIWTNTPGSTARFYLAEIGPEHKGKKVVLDLFDPGDGQSGTYKLQVLAPPQSAPYNTPSSGPAVIPPANGRTIPFTNVADSCKANTSGSTNRGGGTRVNVTNCEVTTRDSGGQKFQNQWLRYEIQLSSSYTCSTDCWWTIKYDFGTGGTSLPNDRTTWALSVIGDPVHLVD